MPSLTSHCTYFLNAASVSNDLGSLAMIPPDTSSRRASLLESPPPPPWRGTVREHCWDNMGRGFGAWIVKLVHGKIKQKLGM